MSKTPNITLQASADKLRGRVLQAKATVPNGISYMHYYEEIFGSQRKKKKELIRRVWNLRATDEGITTNIEKMVEHIKAA